MEPVNFPARFLVFVPTVIVCSPPIPMKIRSFLLACLLLASATACKHHDNGAANNGAANLPDSDYVNGTPLPQRDEGVSFTGPNVDRNRFQPVHFAFDSYTVSGEESGRVQEVAGYLQSSGKRVIVAGFCDERGTAEYNRALGEKRAEAVRDTLLADGVAPERVQTVSFGSEMPVDPSSNENAWARNRRAEFGITR